MPSDTKCPSQSTVYRKFHHEASQASQDLRRIVAHANLLDGLQAAEDSPPSYIVAMGQERAPKAERLATVSRPQGATVPSPEMKVVEEMRAVSDVATSDEKGAGAEEQERWNGEMPAHVSPLSTHPPSSWLGARRDWDESDSYSDSDSDSESEDDDDDELGFDLDWDSSDRDAQSKIEDDLLSYFDAVLASYSRVRAFSGAVGGEDVLLKNFLVGGERLSPMDGLGRGLS